MKVKVRGTITRTLTKGECPWLIKTIPEGTTVYYFAGATYGCITPAGYAVSERQGENPFFEVPRDAVKWDD